MDSSSENTSLATSISFFAQWGSHHLPPGGPVKMESMWVTCQASRGHLSSVTCSSWSFLSTALLGSLLFTLKSLQVCALTTVSPFLPGPAEDKCQELLCRCDQEIAYCLAQTEYNLKYLFYPRFLCGQDLLNCD